MRSARALRVQGSVAPGFESVRALYEQEMRTMAEEHTQLCVYHRGERVVDLWAAPADDAEFSPDSLVNVFSSGKSLESIAMAVLVGRGLLDYAAPVARYWPEFAANDKGEVSVADVLRHEGGMAAFRVSLDPDDLLPANLKQNKVGAVIEGHSLRFPAGGQGKREYHAITRGWILNEVFRRVDPAGRTIGEFYEEEIRRPLEADVIIGVRDAELWRIVKVRPLGILFQLLQSLMPMALGRKIKHHFFQIVGRILQILPGLRHATTRGAPPPYRGMKGIGFFDERSVAMGETPSAGAKCSARGLAKVAAAMAARGRWGDREVVSEAAWEAMHDAPVEAFMGFAPTCFTQGGVNRFTAVGPNAKALERAFNEGREGFFGWMGLGGSIFQWHPGHEIGFAFVPSALHVLDILNERGKVYQAEVLRCVARLRA
jgi:CubicO group peptidase (beta-lactamase class C family)